jgi:hypothetical protein
MTDELPTYKGIGWNFASHQTVLHGEKEYSILKRGIYGVFHHVSEAHLRRYLAEFDFRYTYRVKLGFDDKTRADLALAGAKGKRLTYRTIWWPKGRSTSLSARGAGRDGAARIASQIQIS